MALKLQAEIGLNSESFHKGMDKVKESVAGTIKAYALGAIGVYSLERAFEATIETAKELTEQSERLGVTVEQLQVMRKAASDAGVEMDALAGAMEKLNVFRAKALVAGPAGSLARGQASQLGITPAMLKNMDAQTMLFGPIAQKIRSVNPQEIAAPLREVLGRGFGQIIPVLTRDIDELQAKMKSLGMIMSAETARDLKQLDEAAKSVQNIFINALAPALVGLVEIILGILTSGGLLSKAFEGIVFWINSKIGGSNLPAYHAPNGEDISATERARAASDLLTMIGEEITKVSKIDPSKTVSEQENIAYKNIITQITKPYMQQVMDMQNDKVSSGFDPAIFADYKGNNLNDLDKYINSLIQPVSDVDTESGKSTEIFIAGLKQVLEDMKNKVEPPKPPVFKPEAQTLHEHHTPEDSLISVGNFLGSSRGVINSAQARLEQHAHQTSSNTQQTVVQLKLILDKLKNPPTNGDTTQFSTS